ncbi:MAG: glycosyltransferase family 2 protein [Coriobacteriales bacterium]|nr:glycosyltransferase family 2 protein [Coriobacteriales bacterium]
MKAIALIPAYNEADLVGATVEAVCALSDVEKVVLIDDGSTDGTDKVGRRAGACVLRLERNGGKGAALAHGIASLEAPWPDAVLLLDADLGASAREAKTLLAPIAAGLADMTVGVLPKPPGSGGFGVVVNLARGAIREWGGGYDAQAPLSGQRALSWECLQAVLPFAEGYGVEVALTIRALKQHYRVLEVMVDMRHRATGRDLPGFLHRARQYLDVRRTIKALAQKET